MASYRERYGVDWPAGMSDEAIGLTVGKKWRMLRDAYGIVIPDPWVPMIDAMRSLFGDAFRVSKWTEEHVHDWVMYPMNVIWGAASTGKSYDVGACIVADWIIDPYDTVTLVGSTTLPMLRKRTWAAVETCFSILKASSVFAVPGKLAKTGFAILNDSSEDPDPRAVGDKAGIHGVALNEGGKLQGAHADFVRVVVDELATINDHEAIREALVNLSVTRDFRFIAMANPNPWSDPSSSVYCTPVKGISSVSVDTDEWMSTFGAHVRHNDGLKSPCVLDPSKEAEFPFLVTRAIIESARQKCGGDENAASFWKMMRGFPTPVASGMPPVLDPTVAVAMKVQEPGPAFTGGDVVAFAAGIDPAWTEGGDGAKYAGCAVRLDAFGRCYLDFTGRLRQLKINAKDTVHPPVEQMRNQVLDIVRRPGEAPFENTAVDASANQGLASDLMIYAGADCLAVNNSERASELPLRDGEQKPRPAKETVYDRGTEAWCVLAEYCRAGMVRGLPPEAVKALTMRTFEAEYDRDGNVVRQKFPLRLESKKRFRPRFGGSPDDADACALCALSVKERVGIPPYGFLKRPVAPAGFQFDAPPPAGTVVRPPAPADYGSAPCDGDADGDWRSDA